MKYILTILALVIFTTPAYAEISTSGLTATQKAELSLEAAKMKEARTPEQQMEQLSEYADLGSKYGIALSEVARHMGKTADELLNTKVGLIAALLIVWTIIGKDLLGAAFGFVWFITIIPIWIWWFRRVCIIDTITKSPVEGQKRLRKTITYKEQTDNNFGWNFALFFALFFMCLPGFFAIFG